MFSVNSFIKKALEEDLFYIGDITTDNLFNDLDISKGEICFREEAIVCGVNFAEQVFKEIDPEIKFNTFKTDGELIEGNQKCAVVEGRTKSILKGERLALNIMQRLSGIATRTEMYVKKLRPYNVRIADTRKTTPLFRYFEKYAVKVGGGSNHRFGLFDAVMIKDNHIVAAGGILNSIEKLRKNIPHTTKIEIEVENYNQAVEALEAKADIIMLDNIRGQELEAIVKLLKGKVIVEASGNINLDTVEDVASSGVDVISTGDIIYNARNIDIGMDFKEHK